MTEPDVPAVERIGKYELLEVVGVGGMGKVWRARDVALQRTVALKLLQRSSDEDLTRFRREALAVAGLSHPNIAQLYEFSEDPPFLAMQFVDGVPMDEAPEPLRPAALRDAARAIGFANRRGLIHRDLKPGNILVDRDGRAFVLDFGIAREVRPERTALTVSGNILGTPSFMAPEQAEGRGDDLDARTDVYGLGATLYMLLTGRPPHMGPSAYKILRNVMESDPAPPRADRDLTTICMKAIEKDPARRYPSADDFADDLDRFLRKEPILARPASALYRWKKRFQRQPVAWTLGVLLTLSILFGAAFGAAQLVRVAKKDRDARLVAERARLQAEADQRVAVARAMTEEARAHLEVVRAGLYMPGSRLIPSGFDFVYSACDGALGFSPGYLPALGCKAEALLVDGRFDEAVAALEDAVSRIGPPDGRGAAEDRLLALLGRAYLDRGFRRNMSGSLTLQEKLAALAEASDQARRCFEKVSGLRTDLEGVVAECYRLLAEGKDDRMRERARWAREAFGVRPGIEDLDVLEALTQLGEARIACYTRAIELRPGHFLALMLRGTTRAQGGDLKGAVQDYGETLRIKPDLWEAYLSRSNARKDLGDAKGAIEDADAALRIRPSFAGALIARGNARGDLGDLDEALDDYTKAIDAEPRLALAWYNRGSLRYKRGELAGAAADFEKALGIRAQYGDALIGLAAVAIASGDRAEAIKQLRRALAVMPLDWSRRGEVEARLKGFGVGPSEDY